MHVVVVPYGYMCLWFWMQVVMVADYYGCRLCWVKLDYYCCVCELFSKVCGYGMGAAGNDFS